MKKERIVATLALAPCMVCGERAGIDVTWEEYEMWLMWRESNMLIQEAFPNWDADKRELLMTGTHPKCWDEMFPPDE